MSSNLGELVDEARRRNFVGRHTELAAFSDALGGANTHRILFVHGPGGIGKTTLLREFRARAIDAGRRAVLLDGRDIDPSPSSFEQELLRRLELEDDGNALLNVSQLVVLVDGYELLGAVDTWLRTELLASLAVDSVVVLAGREPPAAAWRSDPGWREVVRIHPMTPLDKIESDELLERAGIDDAQRSPLIDLGRGHPLALALLADVASRGPVPERLSDSPDLVAQLLRVLVSDVPDEAHAIGLATCAHTWLTTEDLLRVTVGDDAPVVWQWLESRPFVVRGVGGLHPHDLARDVLEAEFERRSPERYRLLHRAIRDQLTRELRDGGANARPRAAQQIMFLHRHSPMTATVGELRSSGSTAVVPGQPADHEQVLALVQEVQGDRSAELCERWLEEQPEALWLIRGGDRVLGFGMHIVLPSGSQLEHDDPVVRAILDQSGRAALPRPGELTTVGRFFAGVHEGQRDPYTVLVGAVVSLIDWFRLPLAWSWIVSTDPEYWDPALDYLALTERVVVEHDGRQYVARGIDWRRIDVDVWFDMMGERELSGETGAPPPHLLRPTALGHEDFVVAVRTALTDLRRPDMLGSNPLMGSRLASSADGPSVERLAASIGAAIELLGEDPKAAPLARVLDGTYRHGAPTQEAAAEVLGLAFSTYRRHLTKAHEQLADLLWAVEIGSVRLNLAERQVSSN